MSRLGFVVGLVLGCGGEPGGSETGDVADSVADSDTSTPVDSDTGGIADSDSGDTGTQDSDTDGPIDTDTGAIEGISLETNADAKFVGEQEWDGSGCVFGCVIVAQAGDADLDGFDDFWIGMPSNDRVGGGALDGAAYFLRGPVTGTVDLSAADGILLGSEDERAGASVSSAGDVNADGYEDVIVGAPYFEAWVGDEGKITGQAYLFHGPVSGDRSLADADAVLQGDFNLGAETGWSVSGAGDVDGDGDSEVLVAAPYDGTAYLVRGPMSGLVDLPTESAVRWGSLGDNVTRVAEAGDTNGDGRSDVLLAAPSGGPEGVAFLFSDPPDGDFATTDADAVLWDDWMEEGQYCEVASTGDATGDGYDDILVGGRYAPREDYLLGATYLIAGPIGGMEYLASAASATLIGTTQYDYAHLGIDGAGDVNADGLGDVIVGASTDYADGPGTAYLLLSPLSGTISLSESDFIYTGSGDDKAGYSVAGAGDVDADGLADILIGGPGDDDGGEDAGAAWLVLGASMR